jgi:hypothetical protein
VTWVEYFDQESPVSLPDAVYGDVTQIRVRRSVIDVSGAELWSDWVTRTVSSKDRRCLLVGADGTYQALNLLSEDSHEVQDVSVTYGLGGSRARVDYSPVKGRAGTIGIWIPTRTQADELNTWLKSHPEFVIRWRPERDPESPTKYSAAPNVAARLVSGWNPTRWFQGDIQDRKLSIEWVEQ